GLRGGGRSADGAAHRAVVGTRPAVRPPRRRAVRGGPAADPVMRALQGRGPARGGRAGGGGAVGRRLRAVGRRAGGAVRPGCGSAAAPGSARGSRLRGDGLTLRRPAVAAELYAAAELSRNGCTGGIVERRDRKSTRL